jgi:holo-[acyl-carrier protein] synthase
MSIIGVGVEWVDAERFLQIERRFGSRLHARIFTCDESAYAARFTDPLRSAQALAVRFAAKVAARQALGGAGISGVGLSEVEVLRNAQGRPQLQFHGSAHQALRGLGVVGVSVTLTHDRQHCIGQVILEAAS